MKQLLLAAALMSNSPPPLALLPATNPVAQVMCENGQSWGTAFRIGPREALSVAHVVKMKGCTINGKPFRILEIRGDFAVLKLPEATADWLTLDCRGFVKGRSYMAEGYARNGNGISVIGLTGTGTSDEGEAELIGVQTVIPGQSGGPIIDAETLKVVGTVNAYDAEQGLSLSEELREESVCRS